MLARNQNTDSMLTLRFTGYPKKVTTKDTAEKPSVRATGSVRSKVCLTESQTDSTIAKDTGRMSAVPNIHT